MWLRHMDACGDAVLQTGNSSFPIYNALRLNFLSRTAELPSNLQPGICICWGIPHIQENRLLEGLPAGILIPISPVQNCIKPAHNPCIKYFHSKGRAMVSARPKFCILRSPCFIIFCTRLYGWLLVQKVQFLPVQIWSNTCTVEQ